MGVADAKLLLLQLITLHEVSGPRLGGSTPLPNTNTAFMEAEAGILQKLAGMIHLALLLRTVVWAF